MPDVAADATIRPNLLIIGAARSGTTALHHFLSIHPDIFFCSEKEPHFLALGDRPTPFTGPHDRETFDRFRVTDPRAYVELFKRSRDYRVRGEASVSTLYHPDLSIPRITEFCDADVKLIVLLRDPVERAHSSYLFQRSRALEPIADFGAALDQEDHRIAAGWHHLWHYIGMSRYSRQVPHFVAAFGHERLLVLRHDDLVGSPAETLEAVFRFVGVPSMAIDTAARMNLSGEPRSPAIQKLARHIQTTPRLRDLELRLIPERLRRRLRAASLIQPTLDPVVRHRLERDLATDIDYFARLTSNPTRSA